MAERITPDRVVRALHATKTKPVRGPLRSEGPLVCGLVAVCAARIGNDGFRRMGVPIAYMAGILKIDPSYALGFAFGWNDGWSGTATPDPTARDAWGLRLLGWMDGANAADAAFEEFPAAH